MTSARRVICQIRGYINVVKSDKLEEFDTVIIGVAQKYRSLFTGRAGLSEFHIWHEVIWEVMS